jgi:LacI family transcriptional regulator, galactose operon repressor
LKVRVADIARIAGVSTATVDRVLNNRPGVHPRTGERVRQALERLNELDAEDLEQQIGGRPSLKAVDFVIPTGANPFLQAMADEVDRKPEEFSLFGVEPRSHRLDDFEPAAIAERLRALAPTSSGVCVVAIDHPIVREAVNALSAAGVPVVTLLTDISNSRQLGYVGIDNYAAGRMAGYLMGRFLRGGAAEVGLLAGNLTYRGHAERELGFKTVLAEEFPHVRVVEVREGRDDDTRSQREAEALLSAHPKLRGLYNCGAGASGVAAALVAADRRDVVLIAHELSANTRALLVEGVIDAIINQNFAMEIRSAIKMIMNHHAGRDARANVDPVPIEVFFRENLP